MARKNGSRNHGPRSRALIQAIGLADVNDSLHGNLTNAETLKKTGERLGGGVLADYQIVKAYREAKEQNQHGPVRVIMKDGKLL